MLVKRVENQIIVEDAGEVEQFAVELLKEADPRWLTYDGETIRITVDNGTWTYRVTTKGPHWVTGELVLD